MAPERDFNEDMKRGKSLTRSLGLEGLVRSVLDDDWIAGHEMDGLWIAQGPDFGLGEGVSLDLYDIALTLLHAMWYAIPEDIDGEVRRDLFRDENQAAASDPTSRAPLAAAHETELSDKDRERINERLKQLGYVD